ncbi:MAG TPA: dTDP-4-dehydrorhamnose reductase [Lysobacter sp.]|nr:dTDP-4-dehydrorhamnose reductase [Lysobacter sp.]
MTTLLIGGTGQVGHELARRLAGTDLVVTTRSGDPVRADARHVALDVTDLDTVRALIEELRPACVINAAAHTAVDRAESEPELAFRINAEAPRAMAEACATNGARFVHYSTDYVFDGSADRPYRVDDPTAPLGVYGRSKRAAEEAILASGADALILRTAWVYGLHGQNFLRTMLRLAGEREELSVVDDQIGSPTPAWLIAAVTVELLGRRDVAGIHHLVAAGQTSWCGFANAIFDSAARRGLVQRVPRVRPIPTSAYPTPARRPAFSVLDTGDLTDAGVHLPDWRDALETTLDRATPGTTRSV